MNSLKSFDTIFKGIVLIFGTIGLFTKNFDYSAACFSFVAATGGFK